MTQPTTRQAGAKGIVQYLAVLFVVAGGLVFFYGIKGGVFNQTPMAFIQAKGLPETASIEAFLEARKTIVALPADQDSAVLPDSFQNRLAAPYQVNASIKLLQDQYRDFSFIVGKDRLSIVADGFHAGDFISLDLNDETVFKRVPADWSGKLELIAVLPEEKDIEACIRIAGKADTFHLCHAIPERQAL